MWVTNQCDDNAMRIEPSGGGDGLGVVDLTVDLGSGAYKVCESRAESCVAFPDSYDDKRYDIWLRVYSLGVERTQLHDSFGLCFRGACYWCCVPRY